MLSYALLPHAFDPKGLVSPQRWLMVTKISLLADTKLQGSSFASQPPIIARVHPVGPLIFASRLLKENINSFDIVDNK
jgi:hypothetical protein